MARFVSLTNLARQSHRPPTRVGCPTHECGWLFAYATSSEDGNWCLFVAFVFLCSLVPRCDCGRCTERATSLATGASSEWEEERQKSRAEEPRSRSLLRR